MDLDIGKAGEHAAANFLAEQGYRIIGKNYRRPFGEIDIIAERDKVAHFVEVKASLYFQNTSFIPEVRIDRRKVRNLKKICETYLQETDAPMDKEWQIDVVSVILNSDGSVRDISLIENAVFEKRY